MSKQAVSAASMQSSAQSLFKLIKIKNEAKETKLTIE
jgi:hypothetical protein